MPKRIEREPMVVQVEFYKKRIGVLESENERLRGHLDRYSWYITIDDLKRVEKDAERWRDNLPHIIDVVEDLAGYIDQQWQSRDQYPDQERKYNRDMESVRKLKAATDAAREEE